MDIAPFKVALLSVFPIYLRPVTHIVLLLLPAVFSRVDHFTIDFDPHTKESHTSSTHSAISHLVDLGLAILYTH